MLGNASHVMPPYTGKGVNLAMLDALELADALTEAPGGNVTASIAAFEARMQKRTSQETGACLLAPSAQTSLQAAYCNRKALS